MFLWREHISPFLSFELNCFSFVNAAHGDTMLILKRLHHAALFPYRCLRYYICQYTSITLCSEFILLHYTFQKQPTADSTPTSFLIPAKHWVLGHFLWLVASQLSRHVPEAQSTVSWMFGWDCRQDVNLPLNTLQRSYPHLTNTHTHKAALVHCSVLSTEAHSLHLRQWLKFTVSFLLSSPSDSFQVSESPLSLDWKPKLLWGLTNQVFSSLATFPVTELYLSPPRLQLRLFFIVQFTFISLEQDDADEEVQNVFNSVYDWVQTVLSGDDYICAFFCLNPFSSWAELISAVDRIADRFQTWQVSDQLGRTGPTNPCLAPISLMFWWAKPSRREAVHTSGWLTGTLSGSLNLPIGVEIRSEHVSQTDMTFGHSGALVWLKMEHRIPARVTSDGWPAQMHQCTAYMFMDAYVSVSAQNRKPDEPVTLSFFTLHKNTTHPVKKCLDVCYVRLLPVQYCQQQHEWCYAKTWWPEHADAKIKSQNLKCTKQLLKKLL